MVKVNFFFILSLFLSFETLKCALIAKIFDITGYSGNINTPKKLERVVSLVLASNIRSVQVDSETSLFNLLTPIFASIAGISETEQHKIYIDALFDYMNKACLAMMVKIKRGQLTAEERTEIIQKIWLTSHETTFMNDIKYKITFPDKSLIFMLKVLKSLDSNSCNTRGMILKFSSFCESEESQELVYSSILNSFNCQNKILPLLGIKYNLKATEKYDAFVLKCYEIFESERSNIIPSDCFVKNIINGPGTAQAAEILFKIINKDSIIKISRQEVSIKNFTRFLLNTNTFDEMFGRFLSDYDERLESMKAKMLKIKTSHEAIMSIIEGSDLKLTDSGFMQYIDLFIQHKDLLKDYYDIDPDFTIHIIIQLNNEIINLMEYFDILSDPSKKLVLICIIYIILHSIPTMRLNDIPTIDYEPLLDAYLRPDILELIPNISADHISKVITLSNGKLQASTLEKLFAAFKICKSQFAEERFQLAVTLALYWRQYDDQIFLAALNTILEFYESKQLDITSVLLSLMVKFMASREYFLAHKLLKIGREKKIIPKTFDILTDNYLENYGRLRDIQQIEI